MHIDDFKLGLKRWISWKPRLLELERTLEIIHSKPFILWLRTVSPEKIAEWLWANFLLSGRARSRSQVSWHPVRSQVSWLLVQGSFHYTHTDSLFFEDVLGCLPWSNRCVNDHIHQMKCLWWQVMGPWNLPTQSGYTLITIFPGLEHLNGSSLIIQQIIKLLNTVFKAVCNLAPINHMKLSPLLITAVDASLHSVLPR